MKKLSVGISDFKELIQGNYIYVDKTEYVYKLINSGKYYFLSRPRRFGKSLLISTISYLFQAERELFKGLYIEDKWNWDEIYPVIRVDFSKDVKNKDDLKEKVYQELKKNYMWNSVEIPKDIRNESILLEELIMRISEKEQKQVVILVDEYDKPILDLIENKKRSGRSKKGAKGFLFYNKKLR
jgi:hypothetical protein